MWQVVNITVTDAATIAQLAAIDTATTGTITYTAGGVTDTATNLATNTDLRHRCR